MTKNKIYDVITYNGEKELFDLRYNILKDVVDEFIVVEFVKTFSGKNKLLTFRYGGLPDWKKDKKDWIGRWPKVNYYAISEAEYDKYKDLALSSPNTNYGRGAEHWVREFCQKESIKDCLTHLKDDDIVFIGDCDEIWNPGRYGPETLMPQGFNPVKLKLQVYTYWLNNLSSEEFYGTLVARYKDIKNECLNHLRTNSLKVSHSGWHFTSMAKSLKQKLKDSYTEETYANKQVMDNLDENIENDRDFLGRDFKYTIDEENWPQYLKDNRKKYLHLLRKE